MPIDRIEADYLLETPIDPRHAAEIMAGEQSSGTFVAVPGETPELKARSPARVDRARRSWTMTCERRRCPSLRRPEVGPAPPRAEVTLSWPLDTRPVPAESARDGRRQPLRAEAGQRAAAARHPHAAGLRRGLSRATLRHRRDTRSLAGRDGRPLIGTIIKPSVGLRPEATAALVKQLCEAGHRLHQGRRAAVGRPGLPLRRARPGRDARDRGPGRPDRQEGHVRLQPHRRPRPDAPAPRHAARPRRHLPDGEPELGRARRHDRAPPLQPAPDPRASQRLGLSLRHPLLGWSYVAWQKIWRLAGADHMHVNGLQNKFSETDESVIESAREPA